MGLGYIRKSNEEIYTCKETKVNMVINSKRLRYMGHTERMSKERTVKIMAEHYHSVRRREDCLLQAEVVTADLNGKVS